MTMTIPEIGSVVLNESMIDHFRVTAEPVFRKGTIETLVVPWDRPTWVADDLPDGTKKFYTEGFRRTALDHQLFRSYDVKRSNAGRVMFRHMHDRAEGFGPLGIGRDFEVRDEGLWGEFHIIEEKRSTLLSLVEHGIAGLSVEFRAVPGGSTTDEDGVVWRHDVRLSGVALEHSGAYPEAQVLAMRSEAGDEERQAAEKAEAEKAEKAAAEAEALAAQKLADEESQKQRRQAEADVWIAEQERLQAELTAKYK